MRKAFINFLIEQAKLDPNLYLIVDDTGFSVIEPFAQQFPERYINAGIAEQNMTSVAAGLAMAGKNVYLYGIIPFMTMRCFEQIRNDLCYQKLPVKIIGVGGGLSYGTAGSTHHALEDANILRTLPGMTVVAPGSVYETTALMPSFNALKGPAYLKCGNIDEVPTYPENPHITVGKAIPIIPHDTAMLITTGNALDLGWQVVKHLQEQYGLSIGLTSMPTIKPLDIAYLLHHPWKAIFTLEEQFIMGGFGQDVAHVLLENRKEMPTFKVFGINDTYFHMAGSRNYLRESVGLSKEKIAAEIACYIASPSFIPASTHELNR